MAPKKDLYLHIGTVKTGTTALQKFFDLNRQTLMDNNIFYPLNSDGRFAHHRFSWSLSLSEGRSFPQNWPSNLGSHEDEWSFLKRQCIGQKNLISSEHFYGRSSQSISTLKKYFSDFNVKIVIYWRRRDYLEDSWYNQLIKQEEKTYLPSFQLHLVPKNQLDKWAAAFGRENIILRPYEKEQLYKRDVLADFLHYVLGLELNDTFKQPENEANTGLHQVVLEYKRMLNHLNLSLNKKRKLVDPLRDISNVFNREGRKSFPVFSPQQRLELIHNYFEVDAEIARNYCGRKEDTIFFDPLPNPDDEWQAYNELLAEDTEKINNYLAQHYPDKLDMVTQGILMTLGSGEKAHRRAVLKLLPGISSERICRALKKTLEMPSEKADAVQNNFKDLYESRIWKSGMVIKRLYGYLPPKLQEPAQKLARFIFQKITWT